MPTNSELAKKLSGGAITKKEYDRLMKLPHLKKRSGAAVTEGEMRAQVKGLRKGSY